MAVRKKGIFSKILEGPERSEDYARKSLPSSRWALGWDLITTNFGKLVKINLLMFLFILPVFVLIYFRSVLVGAEAQSAPFSQNLGIGYPAFPALTGIGEQIEVRADVTFFLLLFALTLYVSIGIAGGFYVIRNLVWTEGVFVASDFWSGVKKNYKNTLILTILYVIVLGLSFVSIHSCDYQIALNPSNSILLTIAKIISIVMVIIFTIVYMFSLTLSVTYKLNIFKCVLNAFIFTIGFLPINLFFAVLALLSFALLLTSMTSILFSFGLMAVIFVSISLFTLIWTNYSQWCFDECINDRVAGAKKNRGIYRKGAEEKEEFVYKKSILSTKPIKPITDYDVEIVELPTSYSRADLIRLQESKKRMIEDSDKYAEEHANDYKKNKASVDEFMAEPKKDNTLNGKKSKK